MNCSMFEVIFKVYARVGFGEEIYLIGNVPALGCNSIERAIPLVTSSGEFPWWRTKEAIFVPGDEGSVTYRYAVFSNGKFSRWEGDLIRHVRVPKNKALCQTMEDTLGTLEMERIDSVPPSPSKAVALNADSSLRSRILSNWGRRSTTDQEIGKNDAVIIVSYFLPVILSKKSTGGWQASWDKENLLSMQMDTRTIWVGSIRYANAPIPLEEEEAVASVLASMNCFPVFVSQSVHHQFYELYCKQHLWLIMHHIADVYGPLNLADKSVKSQQQMWFNYSSVHKLFREKVMEVYQPGYLIWIHGFHLLLLPSFLRRVISQAKIGYFFHTPFPSSEIWRTMSRREDLLRGILGADQIGFHLYEYARHFMTCCHRLLGYNSDVNANGAMTVNVDGREVAITCIHVGVDLPRLNEVFTSDPFTSEVLYWKNKFSNKVAISGIDRLERLKGIPLKLMAIDKFMQENPHWHGKVVFPFIGITASERGQDYRQTLHDVNIFVSQINDKYKATSNGPVIYFAEKTDREIRLSHRLAYFAAADVLLMTATRDGLNRYPMEFTLARSMHGKLVESGALPFVPIEGAGLPSQGLIIIGEFISSARVMRGAMIVNPWRVDDVKDVIKHALEMAPTDRADRSRRNLEFSTRLTTANWAKHVLYDLKSVERSDDPNTNYAVGFGLQYKIMNLKSGFLPLDVQEVCKAYRNARHRLILLDWGGTLVPNVDKHDKLQAYAMATGAASREGVSPELKSVLETLSSDPKNIVFVVSGKEVRTVTDYFGSIRGLGLAAEHGFYYQWPQNDLTSPLVQQEKAKWQTVMESIDDAWKASAKMVMDIFVQRTHGTYIEQKGNALIWQYSDADPEFGFLQSKELEEHLNLIMANYRVEVIRGGGVADGYIEVRPVGASKGLFLDHTISTMRASNQEVDFILAIGDDNSDEPMFERISLLTQEQTSQLHAYSVTVGKKPTEANSYLDDPAAVLELLQSISKYSNRDRKFFSVMDLPSQLPSDLSGLSSKSVKKDFAESSSMKSGGFLRASSTSQISGLAGEAFVSKATGERHSSKNAAGTWSRPAGMIGTLRPVASVSQISASEYLSSINENNDEDDEGIFF